MNPQVALPTFSQAITITVTFDFGGTRSAPEVHTIFVDWKKLSKSSEAVLMLRIASALNDIRALDFLMHYTFRQEGLLPDYARTGHQVYVLRMWCGHLHEIACLMPKIGKTQKLHKFIEQMDKETRQQYELLLASLEQGSDYGEYKKYVITVRDKMAFHYDPDEIGAALTAIAKNPPDHPGSFHVGAKRGDTRLELADKVALRELFQVIWGVDDDAEVDVAAEVNKVLEWVTKRVEAFRVFGEYLCALYFDSLQPSVKSKQKLA